MCLRFTLATAKRYSGDALQHKSYIWNHPLSGASSKGRSINGGRIVQNSVNLGMFLRNEASQILQEQLTSCQQANQQPATWQAKKNAQNATVPPSFCYFYQMAPFQGWQYQLRCAGSNEWLNQLQNVKPLSGNDIGWNQAIFRKQRNHSWANESKK